MRAKIRPNPCTNLRSRPDYTSKTTHQRVQNEDSRTFEPGPSGRCQQGTGGSAGTLETAEDTIDGWQARAAAASERSMEPEPGRCRRGAGLSDARRGAADRTRG